MSPRVEAGNNPAAISCRIYDCRNRPRFSTIKLLIRHQCHSDRTQTLSEPEGEGAVEEPTVALQWVPDQRYFRIGHIYVSQRQGKSAGVRGALGRARIDRIRMRRFAPVASRPMVPALEQNQTSICSLGLRKAVAED
jgi:hypothetical protein